MAAEEESEEDTALSPRNWDSALAVCSLDRAEDPPWLRVFLFYATFVGTCEAIPLGPDVSFYVLFFFPAKLYIKCISIDVGSGEQSMYMHMSDMFSYYFWHCVFSA